MKKIKKNKKKIRKIIRKKMDKINLIKLSLKKMIN